MCGPTMGLNPDKWIKVMTTEGEFTVPNFSLITIHQALLNYVENGRDDAIMAQNSQKQPVLIYPRQILSVIT